MRPSLYPDSCRDICLRLGRRLADYEPALYSHAEELIATLTKLSASSSPIDLRKMIYFFALDFAGHLAFSSASSFHFLRDRADTEGHATFLLKGAKYVQALNQVSWCYDLLAFLPKSQGVARFREWARERVKERLKAPAQTRDVFTYLVRATVAKAPGCLADF